MEENIKKVMNEEKEFSKKQKNITRLENGLKCLLKYYDDQSLMYILKHKEKKFIIKRDAVLGPALDEYEPNPFFSYEQYYNYRIRKIKKEIKVIKNNITLCKREMQKIKHELNSLKK